MKEDEIRNIIEKLCNQMDIYIYENWEYVCGYSNINRIYRGEEPIETPCPITEEKYNEIKNNI